ncbi:LysR family transcriptional regulator substrate-binding protein [Pasteurella testudinis]|uniref:LysR family transcriptional regulator substrate-binding protein n=1 Tax=Pasteurella testudinis TaxID=761 RepID=UPI0040587169
MNFQISQFLRFNKIGINRINNSNDIQTLLAMISSGIGISILPESSILLGIENIKTIPLSGRFVKWSVGIVRARSHFSSKYDLISL